MVVPRNLNDSTAVAVLFMMVGGGGLGGSPEVHDHLHSFERVQLQGPHLSTVLMRIGGFLLNVSQNHHN